jgi:hypothetical protein
MSRTAISSHDPLERAAGGLGQVLAGLGILAGLGLWLMLLGRDATCPCGDVRFWQGMPTPTDTSQQFADWYSLIHGVFGMALFLAIIWIKPRWSLGTALVAGMGGSAVWEAVENMPVVIAIFHQSPDSYAGDSILNAFGDMVFVVVGFFLAERLPLALTAALAVAAEITVAVVMGDGLILGSLRLLGVPV